jgi:hypothetical protein
MMMRVPRTCGLAQLVGIVPEKRMLVIRKYLMNYPPMEFSRNGPKPCSVDDMICYADAGESRAFSLRFAFN